MVGVNRAWNQKLVWTWTWTTTAWIESLKPSIIKPSICSFKHCCQPWPMNETMHVAEGWQQGTFLPCGRVAAWNAETGKLCRPGSSRSVIPMSERIDSSSSFWSVPCPEQKETIYTISLNCAAQLHKQLCSWESRRIPLLENCSDVCMVCLDIGRLVTPKAGKLLCS